MYAPRWVNILGLIAFLTALGGVFTGTSWGLFIGGGGLFALAVLSLIAQIQFLKRAHHADGIIISYKKVVSNSSEGASVSWHPMVRYALPDGQEIIFESRTSHFLIRKVWPVSTTVDVLYDPYHPKSAIINSLLGKLAPYVIGLMAIAFLVLGMLGK